MNPSNEFAALRGTKNNKQEALLFLKVHAVELGDFMLDASSDQLMT